ncbi:MAG: MBL fold metallo-hydrolase [Candidatus Helarchaeota archaeon]
MAIFRDTGHVAAGVYLIDIGIWGIEKQMAVYVIVSSDKTALVDTGTKKETKTILRELQSLQIKSLDYIISTHSHIDHCGALYSIAQKFPEADICIPRLAVELTKEYPRKSKRFGLTGNLRLLGEGLEVVLDPEYVLKVLDTPGHISDHISLYDKTHQVLFVGDACGAHHLGEGFSRPTAYAPYFEHEKYIQTLLKFQEINPKGLAIASYGFATDQDAVNCIKSTINDYYAWKETVIKAVDENPDDDHVASVLLETFGRSPGELRENRPEQWVKSLLLGIARGFINSLGLD